MTTQLIEGVSIDTDADVALEQLYDEHYVRLVRLAVLLLGDVGRAEEVVQDSFVAIYRRWDELADADVPAYLRQTVVNRSRSVLRHLAVVSRHPPHAPVDEPGADHDVLRGAPAAGGHRRDARDCRAGSARCWRCATTSTCPSARSPRPSGSAPAR